MNVEMEIVNQEPRRLPKGTRMYDGTEVLHRSMSYPLTEEDDVTEGTVVVVEVAITNPAQRVPATVEKVVGKQAIAKDGNGTRYSLHYNDDDRKCWSCTSVLGISDDMAERWFDEVTLEQLS